MRGLGFAALLVAIVAVAQTNSPAYAGSVSPGGNKIDWTAGYPKLTTPLGQEPPTVATRFTVTINANGKWTPTRVDLDIFRYTGRDGTGGVNGIDHHAFTTNFSEEKPWDVPNRGKSVKVGNIKLTCTDGTNQDFANEADSGFVNIRNP